MSENMPAIEDLSRERDFGICLFFTSFARLGISEVSYSTLLLLLVFIISYKLSPSGSQMQYWLDEAAVQGW